MIPTHKLLNTQSLRPGPPGLQTGMTCMALGNCLGSKKGVNNNLRLEIEPLASSMLVGIPFESSQRRVFFWNFHFENANKRSLKRYFKIDEPCGRIGKDVTSLK